MRRDKTHCLEGGGEMNVGMKIKLTRISKGVTGTYVAKRLGIHQTTYSKYENGERRIDANLLPKIADILGVPVSVFFDNEQDNMSHNTA